MTLELAAPVSELASSELGVALTLELVAPVSELASSELGVVALGLALPKHRLCNAYACRG